VWLPINNNKDKHKGDIHLTITVETFESVERQFWKGITDHFDTDSDNAITQEEFNALLEAIGSPLSQNQMEELFNNIDKDRSGTISFEEIYSRVKGCASKVDADEITKNLLPADPNFIWVVMSHINLEVETVGETVLQDSRWRKEVRMPSQKREVGTSRIMVHDRATGQLVEERIPNYIKVAMRIMYTGKTGGLASGKMHSLLQNLTDKQGKKYDDPRSVKDIRPFVNSITSTKMNVLNPSTVTAPLTNSFFVNSNPLLVKLTVPLTNPLLFPPPIVVSLSLPALNALMNYGSRVKTFLLNIFYKIMIYPIILREAV